MRKAILSSVIAFLTCGLATVHAQQDCNIRDFLVQDIQSVKQSAETTLSFVLTASEQEFNKVKQAGGVDVLDIFSLDYKSAQEKARQIAQSIHFDYKSSYAYDYFSQTISANVVKLYSDCLTKNNRNTPGLYVWLDSRKGDFFNFSGFWVGSDTNVPSAEYTEAPTIKGAEFIDKPDAWPRGVARDIVVKRSENIDFYFKLHVGDQKTVVEIVKDPPGIVWDQKPVVADKEMQAAPHGPNPGCSAGSDESCVYPQRPGGSLITNSASIEHSTSDPSTYSQKIILSSPQKICASITQSTGCCECPQSAKGRLSAIERFPLLAQ